jgi:hypothetical protein
MVAILSGIIAAAGWRSLLRTGNRRFGFVILAFALLALKNLAKALTLAGGQDNADLEFAFSLVDLVVVGLIAWPIFLRQGAPAA